jgi:hypothetical protein
MFTFGWLTITAEDLAIWQEYPNAAFTMFRTVATTDASDEFRLGSVELRENLSYSEK